MFVEDLESLEKNLNYTQTFIYIRRIYEKNNAKNILVFIRSAKVTKKWLLKYLGGLGCMKRRSYRKKKFLLDSGFYE